MKPRAGVAAFVLVSVLLVGCGGSRAARGVVLEVDGDLTSVQSFLLRLEDGTDLRLEPAAGLLFDHNAPISHLRDHQRSGEPVMVVYEESADGTLIAIEVGD